MQANAASADEFGGRLVFAQPELRDSESGARTATRWLLSTVAFGTMLVCRQLLWLVGAPLSIRVMSTLFSALVLICAFIAVRRLTRLGAMPRSILRINTRLSMLIAWIFGLTAYGLLRGNPANEAGKETIAALVIVLLFKIGRSDFAWARLRKPLVVVFYFGVLAALLTFRIPGAVTTFEGTEQADISEQTRNLGTIGASLLPLMELGLLVGAFGLVRRRTDLWRVLEIMALPSVFLVNVLIFRFRGSASAIALILASFFVVLPIVRRRIPWKAILVVSALIVPTLWIATNTDAYQQFKERFDEEDMWETRILEAQAFFDDMNSVELLVGRGMGGWYRGPSWAQGVAGENNATVWRSNHFGVLGFVLRGGILLVFFLGTFVASALLRRPRSWYENENNLAAVVLTPMLVVNVLVNPISLDVGTFFLLLNWGFCFSRYSVRSHEAAGNVSSTGLRKAL